MKREQEYELSIQEKKKDFESREEHLREQENAQNVRKTALSEQEEDLRKKMESLSSEVSNLARINTEAEELYAQRASKLAEREKNINTRLEDLKRKELDIERRSSELVAVEKASSYREDQSKLTLQKTEEQSKKLTDLIDTYDKRLKVFNEREKQLQIREIKLSDRESVAMTHAR